MENERKEHFMLRNTFSSKLESRSLSWPSLVLSVRHNMSDSCVQSASGPSCGDPEMFYRHCYKYIMRERAPYFQEHRSKGESPSLSWPIQALSFRHNMSDSCIKSASGPC